MVELTKAVGAKKIAFATSYIEELNMLAKDYLKSYGIEVLNTKGLGLLYDKDMDAMPLEKIYELAKSVDVPEADAVLILCTGVRSVPIIEILEKDLKETVISAIQAFMWYSLKTLGIATTEVKRFGSLFEK